MYPSLSIDCTDKICSIAISDGDNLWQIESEGEKRQARKLLALVDQCLESANISKGQLQSICWAAGPGSFTGLRIATAVSQGLAYTLNLPLLAVSSLEALALSAARTQPNLQGSILVIADAYMGEYYWAAFNLSPTTKIVARLSPDSLSSLEEIQIPDDLILILGNSADDLVTKNSILKINQSVMRAQDLFVAAETQYSRNEKISAMHAEPVYLRSKSAWKTLSQQEQKLHKAEQ